MWLRERANEFECIGQESAEGLEGLLALSVQGAHIGRSNLPDLLSWAVVLGLT